MIPPHYKDKKLLPVDSENVLIKEKNNGSEATVNNQAESSIWW